MSSTEGGRRRSVCLDEKLGCEYFLFATERLLILCPLQQTSDNAKGLKDIERRVQSLSGVLASPVGKDDYAENGRRVELRRFVLE